MSGVIKLKSSRLKTIVPICVVVTGILYGLYFLRHMGDNRGYSPEQPIPFSHKLHAGDLKIDCQYCHAQVSKARVASVPSMNICLNCHSVVKADSPYIQKMKELVAKGDSFEWVRVHDMPDFVFFNHNRHIAKGVACEKCHGDVRKMERITQVEQLNMGFCVNCHRENKAPTNCNACHN